MEKKEFVGRGWSREENAIYIGNLPGRKQVCLYVKEGGMIDVLAYFKTHALAQKALDWLNWLVYGTPVGE